MSAILAYLEQKAALPEREWLRREPRETHPAILDAVRAIMAGGAFYDDEVEREVNAHAGDLPPHVRHGGPGRHRLIDQLGHEVYIAKCCLRDEAATAEIMDALGSGFVPVADVELVEGGRYLVRWGTVYNGQTVPAYGEAQEVRATRRVAGVPGWAFLPKGARTRGFVVSGPVLVKEVAR